MGLFIWKSLVICKGGQYPDSHFIDEEIQAQQKENDFSKVIQEAN